LPLCRGGEVSPQASTFEKLVATLDYPLYVLTTSVKGEPSGCLIGFATQCSIHPQRFLACISKQNHTFDLVRETTAVAVHIIEERDKDLARHFGGQSGDEVDKFAGVDWRYEHEVPVLAACTRWFIGSVLERIDLGDHLGLLLEPVESATGAAATQLGYQQARDIKAGHKP
jgi:flavin reductase (DIM6/NTAB) family NADH-FMN oxidoreductase RutF